MNKYSTYGHEILLIFCGSIRNNLHSTRTILLYKMFISVCCLKTLKKDPQDSVCYTILSPTGKTGTMHKS